MDERVEAGQPIGMVEHQCGQPLAVDRAIVADDFRAEFADHRVVRRAARAERLVPQLVGLDHQATVAGQRFTHEGFAARQAARQSDL